MTNEPITLKARLRPVFEQLWLAVAIVPSAFMFLLVLSEYMADKMPIEGFLIWSSACICMSIYFIVTNPFKKEGSPSE